MHLAGAQLLPFAQSHFTSLSGKHVLALDSPPDFNACLRLNLHLCGAVWVHMLITRAFLTDTVVTPFASPSHPTGRRGPVSSMWIQKEWGYSALQAGHCPEGPGVGRQVGQTREE